MAPFALPTGREEAWRFTPVAHLHALLTEPLVGELQVEADAATGVGVDQVPPQDPRVVQGEPRELAPERVQAQANAVTLVTIPEGTEAAGTTWVRLAGPGMANATLATTDPDIARPDIARPDIADPAGPKPTAHRLVVNAGANCRAVVVLEHTGPAQLASTVQVNAGQAAQLTVVSIQDWAKGSQHLAHHHVVLAKDAQVKHVVVTLGGDLVRVATRAEFLGEGGRVDLLGLGMTSAHQHHEARLDIEHAAPRCTSRATYKNALLEPSARTVWVGDVAIRPQAHGTDSYELNRNLVLSRGARADSVPNLEIMTGQIEGAGHASATGRFDEEQLFYLESRGIPAAQARSMVVHAFLAELIGHIGESTVESALTAAVDVKLAQAQSTPPPEPQNQRSL
jgi:Fe-S cluster assembly protein SufD